MSSTESGARVATAIGVVKWILIALALTAGIISILAAALRDGADSVTVALIIAASTAVWILSVWVLFGWFEHTLSQLVTIARNTAPPQVRYEAPAFDHRPQ